MNQEFQIVVRNLCEKIKSPSLDVVSLEGSQQTLEENLKREIGELPHSLRDRIHEEFFGFGPLDSLLKDEGITEIIINDWNEVWFEKSGTFYLHNDAFLSSNTFDNFIYRLSKKLKTQLTFDSPFVCATYENLRFHIVSPSITSKNYSLAIRKHREKKFTFQELMANQSLTVKQFEFIQKIIFERKNFLVIGATGSGKTTFLNACLQNISEKERVVIVEDSSELMTPNSLSTKILTRKDSHGLLGIVDLAILIREALRMRPDRIVLGEVRGPEAKDLLLALSTGHEGSIGTLHAQSAHEALLRLEMLIQLGAPQWSLESIRRLIYLSINYIFTITRNNKGERKLSHIHRLNGMESFGLLLEEVQLHQT